jgi:hypothetical protein
MIVMYADVSVSGPFFVYTYFQGWLNSKQVQSQSQMY